MSSDNLDNYNGQAYRNFLITSKNKLSKVTRGDYIIELDKWFEYKNVTKNTCGKLLGNGNNIKEVSEDIKTYIMELVEKGKSYSMQKKAYSAIKFFFKANNAVANWEWIAMYLTKQDDDEGTYIAYDKVQLRKLWDLAGTKDDGEREQLAMGTMFSGGPRVGPLPTIRIRHMKFIEEYKLFCVKIYVTKEETGMKWEEIISDYYTFMSPQVSEVAWEVIGKRKPDNYLFVNKVDRESPLKDDALPTAIVKLLREAGIRGINEDPSERHPIQADHGFRKFFDTQCEIAGVKPAFRKFMMGHKKGTGDKEDRVYFQPPVMDLLEGSKHSPGYLVAIPLLTI